MYRILCLTLFFASPLLAQTSAPPPGIVIPFDAPTSKAKTKTTKTKTKTKVLKKTAKKNVRKGAVDDFTATSKPRVSRKKPTVDIKSVTEPSQKATPKTSKNPAVKSSLPPGKQLSTSAKTTDTSKKAPKKTTKPKKRKSQTSAVKPKKSAKKASRKKRKPFSKKAQTKKRKSKKNAARKKRTVRKTSKPKRGASVKAKAAQVPKSKNQKNVASRVKASTKGKQNEKVGGAKSTKLRGTGLLETFDSPMGRIGAVSLPRAVRVRALLRGKTEREEKVIRFRNGSTNVDRKYLTQLSALADYIKATPSIIAVAVIGHADDALPPDQQELLSAARASAVSEVLVNGGVEAARLLIYGLGTSSPVDAEPENNRAVHFELIHQDASLRAPSTQMSTVSVVRFSGLGKITAGAKQSPLMAPATLASGQGFRVTTGRAALVFPCGRLLLAEAGTDIKIQTVGRIDEAGRMNSSIRLRAGHIRLSTLISPTTPSHITVNGDDYRATIQESGASIHANETQLVMTLDQGRATVDLLDGPSIFLSGGQSLLKNPEGVAVHPRLDAPHILTSRPLPTKQDENPAPVTNLRWAPIPGAVGYKVEISSRLTFDWELKRIEQVTNQLDLSELSERGNWFMRIHGLDEYGLWGKPSIVLVGEGNVLKMGAPL